MRVSSIPSQQGRKELATAGVAEGAWWCTGVVAAAMVAPFELELVDPVRRCSNPVDDDDAMKELSWDREGLCPPHLTGSTIGEADTWL